MLRAHRISKAVKNKEILKDISVGIDKGHVASLLGPSGSGKTTLLRVIMGLEKPDSGELHFNNTLISDGTDAFVPPEKREFSMLFQEFTLFPHLNVYDNIVIGLDGKNKSEKNSIADELLDLLEVDHLKKSSIGSLSGGEQQRVALARALAVRPRILLLDEPFSNIDKMMKNRLYESFKKVLKKYEMTTVLATHDHYEAFYFSDIIYVLNEGEIVEGNTPELLYLQPQNPWVASFVGDTNFLSGHELHTIFNMDAGNINPESTYLIRPEEFQIINDAQSVNNAVIEKITFLGFYKEVIVRLKNGKAVKVKDLHQKRLQTGSRISLKIAKEFS